MADRRIQQAEPVHDTVPVARTTEEEEKEFRAAHQPDRPPTPEEEQAADEHGPLDPEVVRNAKQAAERGAQVRGEGEVP